mmetsp:Transcript_5281/g.7813  ORF Transcript_5281/g.7813 Transcript_5281/m.7813 type:complete len:225 (-) Transcript_5281:266-940(-)
METFGLLGFATKNEQRTLVIEGADVLRIASKRIFIALVRRINVPENLLLQQPFVSQRTACRFVVRVHLKGNAIKLKRSRKIFTFVLQPSQIVCSFASGGVCPKTPVVEGARGVKHATLVIQHGQCRQCLNIVRVDGQHVAIYVVRVVCVSNRKQLPGNEAHLQRLFSLGAPTGLHVRNQTVPATSRHSRIFCSTSAMRCGMTLSVDGFAVSSVDRNRHWVIRGV